MKRDLVVKVKTLFLCQTIFCLFMSLSWAQKGSSPRSFNVRDFGAVGDGKTKDTISFQKALDACAIAGGGEVIVPTGNYLIGSVQMGNRTVLRLETNSVIIGSPDEQDYPMMDVRWEGRCNPGTAL